MKREIRTSLAILSMIVSLNLSILFVAYIWHLIDVSGDIVWWKLVGLISSTCLGMWFFATSLIVIENWGKK